MPTSKTRDKYFGKTAMVDAILAQSQDRYSKQVVSDIVDKLNAAVTDFLVKKSDGSVVFNENFSIQVTPVLCKNNFDKSSASGLKESYRGSVRLSRSLRSKMLAAK